MTSKFAGLPGIAHGEADVYESLGTAVSGDQPPDVVCDVSQNENIEQFRINAGQSYAHFKGKALQPDGVDFSDSVSKKQYSGYKSEFESNGSGLVDETLQERYQRIQADIERLQGDYETLAADHHRQDAFIPDDAADFAGKMDQLKSQLLSLQASVKTTPQLRASGPTEQQRSGLPVNIGDAELNKAVLMEQRIRKLEQAFGTDKDLGTLAGDSSSSLTATVTMLKNQMSLLDKDNLDHIENRIQAFIPKLNQAMEKKNHASDSELDKKVTEAYALLKKWEESMNTLPGVVDRLLALKALHEQASSYVQLQQEVEDLTQQLSTKISVMEGNIKLSEESFSQNISLIKKNMEHLEARFKNAKQ